MDLINYVTIYTVDIQTKLYFIGTSKEFNAPFGPIVSKDLQEYRRTFKLQTFINSWVFMFLITTDIISTVLVLAF